jgi:hypothetical protein
MRPSSAATQSWVAAEGPPIELTDGRLQGMERAEIPCPPNRD